MHAASGAGGSGDPARRRITLSDGWLVKGLDTDKPDPAELARESATPGKIWLAACMPAQVHDVLLANGLIPDPHIGANAGASAWVGEKDWAYLARFSTPREIRGPAFLRFEGLDTLADVWLNGAPVGRFENMFREHAVEVRDRLAPPGGQNVLAIVFSSPLRYMRAAGLPPGDPRAAPHVSLRKCHSDFSSYLGARPHAVKVGVYRDVVLDLPEQAWIEDVCVRSTLSRDFRTATLRVRVETAGAEAALRWTLSDPSDRELRTGTESVSAGACEFEVPVEEPRLWWPRMSGPQDLYAMEIGLAAGDSVLDRRRTRFGIREVKPVLKDPATGEGRFRLDVDGRPIFGQGRGCADAFRGHGQPGWRAPSPGLHCFDGWQGERLCHRWSGHHGPWFA